MFQIFSAVDLYFEKTNKRIENSFGESGLPELKVKRKGYWRGPYTYTRNGKMIEVKRTWVSEATYMTEDKGKPGRTPEGEKFFKPKKRTGWEKTLEPATRRSKLLNATDKNKSMHDRYVEAGRMIQELSNVTTDVETKTRAKEDANWFFEKAKETQKK